MKNIIKHIGLFTLLMLPVQGYALAPDTTPPVLTLVGSDPYTLIEGQVYVDAGATANDNRDGDITANIAVNNTVPNPATVATYTITYNVSDAAGNAATQLTRTVQVNAATVTENTGNTETTRNGSSGGGCIMENGERFVLLVTLFFVLFGVGAIVRKTKS